MSDGVKIDSYVTQGIGIMTAVDEMADMDISALFVTNMEKTAKEDLNEPDSYFCTSIMNYYRKAVDDESAQNAAVMIFRRIQTIGYNKAIYWTNQMQELFFKEVEREYEGRKIPKIVVFIPLCGIPEVDDLYAGNKEMNVIGVTHRCIIVNK